MDLNTYITLDATEMASLIKKKEITPIELLTLSFRQLEKVNPSLNALAHSRKSRALVAANQFELGNGLFAGIPTLLKDISHSLEGERLTAGANLLKGIVADHDSYVVQKLHQAGFIFMGHTSTPEFGLKNITESELHGPTRNPWHIDYSPGGSSGGSAAMIASGVVPVAGASDGGGSIRIPASFTGLFGLKPTRGRTPVGPGVGRNWQGASIDFALSRTVRDSAALLDVLQVNQPAAAFQTTLFKGKYRHIMKQGFDKPLKIAFTTKSPVNTPVSEDAINATLKMAKWLESEGHIVEEKENGVDGIQLMKDYFLMNSGEISSVIKRMEQSIGREITANDVEIETWLLHMAGKSVSAAAFSASLASWDVAAAHMDKLHDTYDFYMTPATAYTAPKVGELSHSAEAQEHLRIKMEEIDESKQQDLIWDMFLPSLTYTPFSQLANLTGQPAMSVPVHISEGGLPLGVQFNAPKENEHELLKLAYQLENTELWVGMNGNPYYK